MNPLKVRGDRKKSPDRSKVDIMKELSNEVLFMCPELEEGAHPKNVWKEKIKAYIENKKALDRVRACIIAIKTFNSESEICFSLRILRLYASNLINFPKEQKFRRIRLGNPHIQKITDVIGAIDFLQAIGFQQRSIPIKIGSAQKEELYFVHFPNNQLKLSDVIQELDSVRGFTLSLYRNVKLISPNADPEPKEEEEPDDFYEWTIEDMEREYLYRKNKSAEDQQLRTKNMRGEAVKCDSDFTIIRVKLPDGVIIQATFATKETLADLKSLLRKNVEISRNFFFVLLPTKKFTEDEENKSFFELDLFPSVTLLVRWQS